MDLPGVGERIIVGRELGEWAAACPERKGVIRNAPSRTAKARAILRDIVLKAQLAILISSRRALNYIVSIRYNINTP